MINTVLSEMRRSYTTVLLNTVSVKLSAIANNPRMFELLSSDHAKKAEQRRARVKAYSSVLPDLEEYAARRE